MFLLCSLHRNVDSSTFAKELILFLIHPQIRKRFFFPVFTDLIHPLSVSNQNSSTRLTKPYLLLRSSQF